MIRHIPNLLSLSNLLCGFWALLLNDPIWSPRLILLGALLDLTDGLAARKLRVSSALGTQLDSLADMVNFVVGPAYLYYHHVLGPSPMALLVVSALPFSGAIRLARYNVAHAEAKHFIGLATPSVGLLIAFTAYAFVDQSFPIEVFHPSVLWSLPLLLALLMNAPIRMFTLKGIRSKPIAERWLVYVFLVCIVLFAVLYEFASLPLIILSYIVLSVVGHFSGAFSSDS